MVGSGGVREGRGYGGEADLTFLQADLFLSLSVCVRTQVYLEADYCLDSLTKNSIAGERSHVVYGVRSGRTRMAFWQGEEEKSSSSRGRPRISLFERALRLRALE